MKEKEIIDGQPLDTEENEINGNTDCQCDKDCEKPADTDTQTAENDDDADNVAESDPTEIEKAQKEIEELKDKYLRTVAEFDNFKKRTLKEKADLADKTEDPVAIKEGMELIFKKFNKTLEGMGVKKIETEKCDFNVDYHEAIAMVPGLGDDMKGKVIDCVQTGYTLNDKVIRHAKVAVGQ